MLESAWIDPYPTDALALEDRRAAPEARYEQRESVELAFIAALQHVPARQRAVLILREVLGFSARETADALDTTTASVNSALQRARAVVEERLPSRSQQANRRTVGDDRLQKALDDYMDAWEAGDVDRVVAMLVDDAIVTMPPMPTWYRGRDAVAAFLRDFAFAKRWESGSARFEAGERSVRLLVTAANGQPALAAYNRQDDGDFLPYALQVLSFDGDRIREIDGFVDPSIFPRFVLPGRLPSGS